MMHYRKVLECCHKNGITTVVIVLHFSSPKWLISEGGWENDKTVDYFKKYCAHVVSKLGYLMYYVCTINEANMGLQIASISKSIMKLMGIMPQVGMNFDQMIEKFMSPETNHTKK